jgi:hypothetical protein
MPESRRLATGNVIVCELDIEFKRIKKITNMKSNIKTLILVAALLCSMTAWAQDDTEKEIRQSIEKALQQNDYERAQKNYNSLKAYTNETDYRLEAFIKARALIYSAMNSNPTYTYDNDKYKGQKKDGNRNGLGAYYWDSGNFYFGQWKEGERTGYGIFLWADGSAYVGNFLNSKRSGTGTYYDETGELIYYGEYKDNTEIGTVPTSGYDRFKFEIYYYNDGTVYIGEAIDGKRHGKGIYLWANGDMWYGDLKEGIRDGYGIHISNSGTRFTGTWKGNDYTQ